MAKHFCTAVIQLRVMLNVQHMQYKSDTPLCHPKKPVIKAYFSHDSFEQSTVTTAQVTDNQSQIYSPPAILSLTRRQFSAYCKQG